MSVPMTDEFLDLYRQLETAAEHMVGGEGRGSVILRLSHLRQFAPYRDALDYCRQVRNLLTHEAKIRGRYGVIPDESLLEVLRTVLRLVQDPPTVQDHMTPAGRLLHANATDAVLPLMMRMEQRGVSHVPLMQNGIVTGIFSLDTVFQAVLRGTVIGESTLLNDLAALLPLDQHMGQGFVFVPPELPLTEAADLFDKEYDKNHQIKLLLVTRGGKPNAPLMGVVSPYDLLDQ